MLAFLRVPSAVAAATAISIVLLLTFHDLVGDKRRWLLVLDDGRVPALAF